MVKPFIALINLLFIFFSFNFINMNKVISIIMSDTTHKIHIDKIK